MSLRTFMQMLGNQGKPVKQTSDGTLEVNYMQNVDTNVSSILGKLGGGVDAPLLNPPGMKFTLTPLSSIGNRVPKWMDANGVMYGSALNVVYKSSDYWGTFTTLFTHSDVNERWEAVFATQSGRIVACAKNSGEVWVSDVNQSNFALALTLPAGSYCSQQFGHSVVGEKVFICSYGVSTSGLNEVYMSLDSGATFTRIYQNTIAQGVNNYHIHDVVYDPYASCIWILTGDNTNANIYFSYDFGVTWTALSGTSSSTYQFTSGIVYPHGLVLFSDGFPDRIGYIPRESNLNHPVYTSADLQVIKYDVDASLNRFGYFATRSWRTFIDNKQWTIIPFLRNNTSGPGGGRLMASVDGKNFFDLLTLPTTGKAYEGFKQIVGPHPADTQRRIFGFLDFQTPYVFIGELPKIM